MRRESKFVLVRVCASASAFGGETGLPRGGRALLEARWWHWEAEISVWSGFPGGGGGATPYFIIFSEMFSPFKEKKSIFFFRFRLARDYKERTHRGSSRAHPFVRCVFACVRAVACRRMNNSQQRGCACQTSFPAAAPRNACLFFFFVVTTNCPNPIWLRILSPCLSIRPPPPSLSPSLPPSLPLDLLPSLPSLPQ